MTREGNIWLHGHKARRMGVHYALIMSRMLRCHDVKGLYGSADASRGFRVTASCHPPLTPGWSANEDQQKELL